MYAKPVSAVTTGANPWLQVQKPPAISSTFAILDALSQETYVATKYDHKTDLW